MHQDYDEEDFMIVEDMSDIPTEVLEQIYYSVWVELQERGFDPDGVTKH